MRRRRARVLGGAAAAVLAAAVGLGPAARPAGLEAAGAQVTPAPLVAAQELLHLAYPELAARPLALAIGQQGGDVIVRVAEPVDPLVTGPDRPAGRLLDLVVAFAPDGRLVRLAAAGPWVADAERRALGAALAAHPAWTDADAQAWLAAAGARHAPGRTPEAVRAFDAARWARFLGGGVRVGPAAFRWRAEEAPGPARPFRAAPGWVVETVAPAPGGRTRRATLEFEPFGGRLTSVVVR